MWYVYILECKNKSLYTGITKDLNRRFQEHLKRTTRYTSYNPPIRIVYQERMPTRSQALKREAHIKRLNRPEKMALVAG